MGCNYRQHEIDSCYVLSPIPDCKWIIAHCRGNTWKEFEGKKKKGGGGGKGAGEKIVYRYHNVFVIETWALKLTINYN